MNVVRIDEELKKVKCQYDLLAHGLKSLRETETKVVKEALQRGTKIRILTVDPSVRELETVDRKEKKPLGSTSDSIRQLIKWADTLNEQYPGKCKIKLANYLPNEYFCREDNYIYVGPYQYGKESQRVITMEFKKRGKGFEYYEQYFNDLWNDPEYCHDI